MKGPAWKRSKVEYAALLRRNATPAERKLKDLLDERLSNTRDWPKFKFQRRALGYILDFFSSKCGLCIELDGSGHAEPAQKAWDEERTVALARYGVRVLRIPNARVFHDVEAVLREIETAWRQGHEVVLPKYRNVRYYPKKKAAPKKKAPRSRWGKEARVMGLRRIP